MTNKEELRFIYPAVSSHHHGHVLQETLERKMSEWETTETLGCCPMQGMGLPFKEGGSSDMRAGRDKEDVVFAFP